MFFTFLKLYKWYQIVQRATYLRLLSKIANKEFIQLAFLTVFHQCLLRIILPSANLLDCADPADSTTSLFFHFQFLFTSFFLLALLLSVSAYYSDSLHLFSAAFCLPFLACLAFLFFTCLPI